MKFLIHAAAAGMLSALLTIPVSAEDIVETAVEAGKFNTLATALQKADLVKTLKGAGPFTVFAPTDEAFAALPAGTVETLLKAENKQRLTDILTYHVVPGAVTANQVVELDGAVTVNGQRLDIRVAGSTVKIDGATVVTTDIECDNGIIHVIDSVVLPADESIVETAQAAEQFSTLLTAAKAAGLAETLATGGPFTLFAPTDEAFERLPAGTVESLLQPENKEQLAKILKYHVVEGRVYSDQAVESGKAKSLLGEGVAIRATDRGAYVNEAKLLQTDLDASNGVIHVIDAVLMPPQKSVDARTKLREAIAQGAPLYNAGHHAACAQVYMQTMEGLMSTITDEQMRHHMQTVLTSARHQHCPSERAWTLRRGMDQMYSQLASTRN